jgi:hypothetical protein
MGAPPGEVLHETSYEWAGTLGANTIQNLLLLSLVQQFPWWPEVHLDDHGSTTRAAAELHRNVIAYRVRRIFEVLRVDSEDPDVVLMLQFACRARSLGSTGSA